MLGEQLLPAPQHADAGRAAHLVPGEGDEVGAESLHVDGSCGTDWQRVEQHQRADRVRPGDDLGDRVDGAEDVATVHH